MSLSKNYPKIMKKMETHDGHEYVFLYRSNQQHKMFVHRAVLSAWVGTDSRNPLCLHADDNPKNNNIENLRWGTHKDNSDDKRKNRGYPVGEFAPGAKLKERDVMDIRNRYAVGERSRDLAKEYKVSRNAITEIVSGKTWPNLPLVEIIVPPSSRPLTTISEKQKQIGRQSLETYIASIRKPRVTVECACGCGGTLITPDQKGRDRKYIHGHNAKGKHWNWRKNGSEN